MSLEEYTNYLKEVKQQYDAQNQVQASGSNQGLNPNYHSYPCPSCGHCPTCGRGGRQTYPHYPQVTWVQYPTTTTGYVQCGSGIAATE